MEQEMLTVCEENGTAIGIATRQEVHSKGYWHETFHCWIVEIQEGTPYIHLQLRSKDKKDFPDMLDISAAGHLLANETVEDGVREIREELGVQVDFNELISLGIVKDQLNVRNLIDNERCHVFLYKTKEKLDDVYEFQQEEVAGMYIFDFEELYRLCTGVTEEIKSKREIIAKSRNTSRKISLNDLVPHNKSYLLSVMQAIRAELEK